MASLLHSALVVDAHTRQVMGLALRRFGAAPRKSDSGASGVLSQATDGIRRVGTRHGSCSMSGNRGAVGACVRPRGRQLRCVCSLKAKGDSWVLRAAQLTCKVRAADGKLVKLDALMDAAPLQGTYQVYVSANRHQAARWAKVEVRAVSVTLVRPLAKVRRPSCSTMTSVRSPATWSRFGKSIRPNTASLCGGCFTRRNRSRPSQPVWKWLSPMSTARSWKDIINA